MADARAGACTRLIYLHGFRSSPASFKARLLAQAMADLGRADDFVCPQLPDAPEAAIQLIRQAIAPGAQDVLVGSSLGGFYARAIAEDCGCRAVLLNPALDAPRALADQIGSHERWHGGGQIEWRQADLAALAAIAARSLTQPERYLLIADTGDEVLDWHDAAEFYADARQVVVEGGDHGFASFTDRLDDILRFAGLLAPPRPPRRAAARGAGGGGAA